MRILKNVLVVLVLAFIMTQCSNPQGLETDDPQIVRWGFRQSDNPSLSQDHETEPDITGASVLMLREGLGFDVSNLTPFFVLSEGASISPTGVTDWTETRSFEVRDSSGVKFYSLGVNPVEDN